LAALTRRDIAARNLLVDRDLGLKCGLHAQRAAAAYTSELAAARVLLAG
jgi:hypothetical protein